MYHVIVPLVMFFAGWKFRDFITASGLMCVSSLVLIIVDCFLLDKKIQKPVVVATGVSFIIFFTSLITQDETLIKMKPTIINVVFACLLILSMLFKRNVLRDMLGASLKMRDTAWDKLTRRWIGLFIFLAVANEIVRLCCQDALWVFFKIFGIMIINILFLLMQIPFIRKETINVGAQHSELSKN